MSRPLRLLELGLGLGLVPGLGLGLRSGLGIGLGFRGEGLGLRLGYLVCRVEALVGSGAGEWMSKPNPNSSWLLHTINSAPVADEVSFFSRSTVGYVLVVGR